MDNPFEEIMSRLDRIEARLMIHPHHDPKPPKPTDGFLTPLEAATILKIKLGTLYQYSSKRFVPKYKRNGRIYFKESDLVGYMEAGRVQTVEEIKQDANVAMGRHKHRPSRNASEKELKKS